MKKILATILAATAFAAAVIADDTSADVLVWNLNMDFAKEGQGTSFDTIKFWAVDATDSSRKQGLGDLTYSRPEDLLSGTGPVGSGESILLAERDNSTQNYYTDLSRIQYDNGYLFLMAVYQNGNDNAVSWTEFPISTSLTGIQDAITSVNNLVDSFTPTPFPAFNMSTEMVPEPTSGLLLLVGGALLALRRRRRG